MDRFHYEDFPSDEVTEFPRRVKHVEVFDAEGNYLSGRSARIDKDDMKLSVYTKPYIEKHRKGYVGWFETHEEDSVVVLHPGEYFEVE